MKGRKTLSNYTILHLHSMDSNPYSGLQVDSITPFKEYIDEAVKNNMTAIAFTEHGSILNHVAKKQVCDKVGIKYIHGEEFYITESLDEKKRDNYHCCLFAKDKEGFEELNKLSSISMNREDGHFYYNPRLTFDELINTSDHILINTGCIAGILSKGNDELKKRFLKFLIENKHRCWLEIQPHNFDYQIKYNQMLYTISQKTGLRLIATNDIHAIDNEQLKARKLMQKSKKVEFNDEDECDLTFKTYEGMVSAFNEQNALPEKVILQAIEETNNFANLTENYELDYSPKYPRIYKDAKAEFKNRIASGIKERGIDKLPNYKTEYIPRIQEEFKTYEHNDAIDFMLLDADYKNWMHQNGMYCGPSRGSVSGSLIAYLLHNTDVDSVKYNLNFSRFMNPERVSLADVDTDIYAEDRYKVREYFFGQDEKGLMHCCNIVTFNTIQLRGAIKDIGRAYGLSPDETQNICDSIIEDEDGNERVPDSILEKYGDMFKYVDMVIGVVTSLGRHAAGIVCSPTDISRDFGLLSIESDPRPVSQIDMHEIDSLNYVKMDLLGLNAVGLITKTCQLAGIEVKNPDNTDFYDENVIKSIAEDTTLIFQFESDFAGDSLKKTLSKETIDKIKAKNKNASYIDIISMVSGAIRPAGESYREQLFEGVYNDNGNEELNKFLAPTLGWLVYQEQIIEFLHRFCGFTMGQADIVRRHFAKKTGTEQDIPIIKDGGYLVDIKGNKDPRFIKGFITVAQEDFGMTKEEAEDVIVYFLQVIEDASSYLFSKNHSDPYSMIGYIIGWLRYYYPLELFTAALIIYQANKEKSTAIKTYIHNKGIEIKGVKFRKSKAQYFMDKKENVIYQGIESIAYCNSIIADELFDLKDNHYNSFLNLLDDISKHTSVDARQLDILIRLNFFSEFGENEYLLKVVEAYNNIAKRKTFKKAELDKFGISESLMKKYANKETPKQFSEVDTIGLVQELIKDIPNKPISVGEQLKAEKEYLGYCTSLFDTLDEHLWVVTEYTCYKDATHPYIKVRNLSTGEEVKTDVKSKFYRARPFGEWSILKFDHFDYEFKKKKNSAGQWVATNEMKEILTDYIVVRR